jgi:DMSO/TMAO reductase YedYZ molybdopterin-dependent catalytic subunit
VSRPRALARSDEPERGTTFFIRLALTTRPPVDATTRPATLDYTGGWSEVQAWEGMRLDRLVEGATGRSIAVVSSTGYSRRFPLGEAYRLVLATRVAGETLRAGHGFPARLVAPGRRGFWWVKWVVEVEVSDRSWWLQSPFPLT